MTEVSGGGGGSKILNFPIGDKIPCSPTMRFRAIFFFGPMIELRDGVYVSPHMKHDFEVPATEEQARKVVDDFAKAGGIMGRTEDYYVFIPWPCAAVYFEIDKPEM